MKLKNLLTLSLLVAAGYVYAEEAQEEATTKVVIKSTVEVKGGDLDAFLKEAQEDCKALTKKYAGLRGVGSVETSLENDEDAARCEECGGPAADEDDKEQVKCACGKPKPKAAKSCSSCCSSCSSKPCCKSEAIEDTRCEECGALADDQATEDVRCACGKPKPKAAKSCSSCCSSCSSKPCCK